MGRWLDALKKHENAPDANPQNPQNSTNRGFEGFESFNSTDLEKNSNAASDGLEAAKDNQKTEEPLFLRQSKGESERRRVIPFPGREWTPDGKIRPDDPERYLDALRLHGPMSYGMAMRVLQWGGTRAGQAEDALLEQGRIKFNKRGWAYPVDRSEDENV
ncbi:hypothetical protein [Brucella pituitosa]|uniref:Uncharacterized protein n=1 Tax=Brucella pituitosa TaxID=571256 RepID=A0A643EZ82_9HYPH|nr:hypothetical protein [Brucella pituitosa]KAB0571092.1 hypothetical protein F7Q93_14100 [Brucella pituitosa]